jgi:hypothetical protein
MALMKNNYTCWLSNHIRLYRLFKGPHHIMGVLMVIFRRGKYLWVLVDVLSIENCVCSDFVELSFHVILFLYGNCILNY